MGKKKTAAKRPAAKARRAKSKGAKSKPKSAPGIRDRVVDLRRVKACELRPHPDNWRKHPEAQRSALRDLLAEIGFADVILARELPDRALQIIDGHLRVEEAGESEVPVLVLDLDETEARKLLATLDPLAAAAEMDAEAIGRLLAEVQSESEAVQDLLAGLAETAGAWRVPTAAPPEPRIQEAAALQAAWGTERGQLWEIPGQAGVHRVLCGDATVPADVALVLGGAKPFLCVTDPPYGVKYDPAWRERAAAEGKLSYACRRTGPVANDDRADWSEAWTLCPCDVLYSWHPPGATSLIHAAAIEAAGFAIRMQIIWAKPHFPIGRGDYHVQHEPCWYAVRKGRAARRSRDRTQTTLWEIALDGNVAGGHGTQKPVECMARPIRNHGAAGDGVYDPFVGSGTTMVACEELGRVCYAIEIKPQYVAVTLERLKEMGLKPRLAGPAPPASGTRRRSKPGKEPKGQGGQRRGGSARRAARA